MIQTFTAIQTTTGSMQVFPGTNTITIATVEAGRVLRTKLNHEQLRDLIEVLQSYVRPS